MADGTIPVQNVTADHLLDTTALTVGINTVNRERVVISGGGATELADVKAATPTSGLFGLVVRPLGQTDSGGTDMTDTANHALKVSQAGTWNVATVTTVSTVTAVTSLTNALPAGTNAIGKLAANSGVIIGDVNVVALKDSGGTDMTDTTNHCLKASLVTMPQCIGPVASGSADAQAPVKIGGKVSTSLKARTMLVDANVADFLTSEDQVLYTRPYPAHPADFFDATPTTITSSTSDTSIQGAGAANQRGYMKGIVIANSSATATRVSLKDGSGGTIKCTLPVPASNSGVVFQFPIPLRGTAATAWFAACADSVASIIITPLGYYSKV